MARSKRMGEAKANSFRAVTVQFKNRIVLDVDKMMSVAAKAIPDIIKKRVRRDTGMDDRKLQRLSPQTVERLRLEGARETPILRGPMIEDIVAVQKRKAGEGAILTFRAPGSDNRGRLWSAIGWFHQVGKGVPFRPWFGLSKKDRRKVTKLLEAAGAIKQEKRGGRRAGAGRIPAPTRRP